MADLVPCEGSGWKADKARTSMPCPLCGVPTDVVDGVLIDHSVDPLGGMMQPTPDPTPAEKALKYAEAAERLTTSKSHDAVTAYACLSSAFSAIADREAREKADEAPQVTFFGSPTVGGSSISWDVTKPIAPAPVVPEEEPPEYVRELVDVAREWAATHSFAKPYPPTSIAGRLLDLARRLPEPLAAPGVSPPPSAPEAPPLCRETEGGLRCTRPRGHNGDHQAHGTSGKLLYAWPAAGDDVPPPDPEPCVGSGRRVIASVCSVCEYQVPQGGRPCGCVVYCPHDVKGRPLPPHSVEGKPLGGGA